MFTIVYSTLSHSITYNHDISTLTSSAKKSEDQCDQSSAKQSPLAIWQPPTQYGAKPVLDNGKILSDGSIALRGAQTPTSLCVLAAVLLSMTSQIGLAAQGLPAYDRLPASTAVVLDESERPSLPALGNTLAADRVMLLEVSDSYVYKGSARSTRRFWQRAGKAKTNNSQGGVWQIVKQSTRLQIPSHKRISYYRNQYQQEAVWISRILKRAEPFIGHIVEELDKRYLPVELSLLPAIESGYRPDVLSSQNAAGIWQIIPTTAKDVGLEHTAWFDGRADILDSTTAAVNYLSYLNAEFHGDWLLTLAAYNAGLGRVRIAIKRNTDAGLPVDFWSLKLPTETRNYVPKFLALVAMLRHDRPNGLVVPDLARGSAFDIVDLRQRTSLDRLAAVTGVPEGDLQRLNAGLTNNITPPNGPHRVYVPHGVGIPLVESLLKNPQVQLFSPRDTYSVVAGDNLSSVAQRYKISLQRLKQINGLESNMIRVGQKLTVLNLNEAEQQIEYVVTIGDTLSDIANRFSVKVSDIRNEHGQRLDDDVIHPGERLSLAIDNAVKDDN